jgi:hypothetical protein
VLVIKVFEGSPADGILQENDVILKIDDYDIADDGTIQISQDVLTDYKHAIDMHHLHDQIELTFARDGNLIQTSLQAMQSRKGFSLVRGEKFDEIPQYFIYGGIVFVPLNMNLIKRWGNDWGRTAPVSLLQARNEWATPERRELVVALQVLAADVNLGYHDWRNWVVDSVNGENIIDFARKLRENNSENVVFKNKNGYQMVINHEAAVASEDSILSQYRIPAAYSQGLFD